MLEKLKESGLVILILIGIVGFVFLTGLAPFDAGMFTNFLICSVLVVIGQVIFLSGADNSILLMGKHSGSALMNLKKVWLILLFGFIFGFVTTIAEPDVQVLSQFLGAGSNKTLSTVFVIVVGFGLGLFTLIAYIRILKNIPIQYVIISTYVLIVILSLFVNEQFFALSFDASGMTTGAVAVPFLISLTVGICSVRSINRKEDNFGVAGIASSGTVLAVLIMSFFFPKDSLYLSIESGPIGQVFVDSLINVAIVLSPILIIFIIMQIFLFKFPKKYVAKIIVNYFIAGFGLVLFLTGIVSGFAPMGEHFGLSISSPIVLIILSIIFGGILVFTEPSIKILLKEIEEVSSGLIKQKYIFITLIFAVSIALSLSTIRILYNISLWWFLIPVIILSLILSFFTPKIFFSIAFDSGGIVTGTILVSFVLPFFMGISSSLYFTNINALGVISLTSLMPIVAIESLGVIYNIIDKRQQRRFEQKEKERKLLSYTIKPDQENLEEKAVKEEKWTKLFWW